MGPIFVGWSQCVFCPGCCLYQNYHQQYDAKPNARGYCGLRPLGVELDISGLEERWKGFVRKGWKGVCMFQRVFFQPVRAFLSIVCRKMQVQCSVSMVIQIDYQRFSFSPSEENRRTIILGLLPPVRVPV